MPTAIIQSPIFADKYVLTSMVQSISATTDQDLLEVSLSCGQDTFFSVKLYALNGVVELFDAGSIIDNYFIAKQLIHANITVSFGSATASMKLLYCDYVMPPDFSPDSALLLSSTAKRVHLNSTITMAALPAQHSTLIIKAVGKNNTGLLDTATFQQNVDFSQSPFTTISVAQIIANVATLSEVLYFSIEYAAKQLMCYITPADSFLTFRFRNIFNVPEIIDIQGIMVTKSEAARQSATCNGQIVQYDRQLNRTYQFTSGPLPADEIEALVQLVESHEVQIFADNSFHDIIVEDHTCENSTDNEALTTIKFTWRFKQQKPVIFNSSLFGVQTLDRKIFSDQYSIEYD